MNRPANYDQVASAAKAFTEYAESQGVLSAVFLLGSVQGPSDEKKDDWKEVDYQMFNNVPADQLIAICDDTANQLSDHLEKGGTGI